MSKTAYKVGDILDDKTLAIGIVKADNEEVTPCLIIGRIISFTLNLEDLNINLNLIIKEK